MFMITNFFTVAIPIYGMLGIWTRTVGYHNLWEFWLYNIVFGLFQAPYYAVSCEIRSWRRQRTDYLSSTLRV